MKPTRLPLCVHDRTKALANVTGMICRKCRNRRIPEYYFVCSECYSRGENLPSSVSDSAWITILSGEEQREDHPSSEGEKLRHLILASFKNEKTIPDPKRKVVIVGGIFEVPVQENALDQVAKQSGLVTGKWLIYAPRTGIDDVWKTIASSTLRNELGVDTKVSTVPDGGVYVVCVYTRKLFYKPNIYTYLKIYRGTFPGIRASRYAE